MADRPTLVLPPEVEATWARTVECPCRCHAEVHFGCDSPLCDVEHVDQLDGSGRVPDPSVVRAVKLTELPTVLLVEVRHKRNGEWGAWHSPTPSRYEDTDACRSHPQTERRERSVPWSGGDALVAVEEWRAGRYHPGLGRYVEERRPRVVGTAHGGRVLTVHTTSSPPDGGAVGSSWLWLRRGYSHVSLYLHVALYLRTRTANGVTDENVTSWLDVLGDVSPGDWVVVFDSYTPADPEREEPRR